MPSQRHMGRSFPVELVHRCSRTSHRVSPGANPARETLRRARLDELLERPPLRAAEARLTGRPPVAAREPVAKPDRALPAQPERGGACGRQLGQQVSPSVCRTGTQRPRADRVDQPGAPFPSASSQESGFSARTSRASPSRVMGSPLGARGAPATGSTPQADRLRRRSTERPVTRTSTVPSDGPAAAHPHHRKLGFGQRLLRRSTGPTAST